MAKQGDKEPDVKVPKGETSEIREERRKEGRS